MPNEQIKGYNNLSDGAKKIFDYVDAKHSNAVGDKAAWKPVRVKERITYVEVHFINGEWLHYMPNGTWF